MAEWSNALVLKATVHSSVRGSNPLPPALGTCCFLHMTLYAFVFDILYFVVFVSAVAVVLAPNPVHAILFLVVLFLDTAALFILLGAEFLGLVLIVVYVGAVAVLFLFVCMMLNVRLEVMGWASLSFLPVGALVFFFFITITLPAVYSLVPVDLPVYVPTIYTDWSKTVDAQGGLAAVSSALYTFYGAHFFVSAFVLLLAMVGSIAITLWRRFDSRKQSLYVQVTRDHNWSRVYAV